MAFYSGRASLPFLEIFSAVTLVAIGIEIVKRTILDY